MKIDDEKYIPFAEAVEVLGSYAHHLSAALKNGDIKIHCFRGDHYFKNGDVKALRKRMEDDQGKYKPSPSLVSSELNKHTLLANKF